VLELLTHFVGLLVQLLDLNFSGSNIALKFLDLVVEDELELFEFLSLLLEVVNSLVLVTDGGLTLLNFALLRVDLLTQRVSLLDKVIKLLLLLMNVLLGLLFLVLCFLVVIGHESELSLAFHTSIDDLGKLLLVLLLDTINVLPSLVLNAFTLILVLCGKNLAVLSQSCSFSLLLLKLKSIFCL